MARYCPVVGELGVSRSAAAVAEVEPVEGTGLGESAYASRPEVAGERDAVI